MKKAILVVILLIMACALSACWSEPEVEQDPNVLDDQSYQPETVYIGCLLPFTGSDAERAELLKSAQETAMLTVNGQHNVDWDVAATPGIIGYGQAQVELVYADCGVEEEDPAAPTGTKTQPAAAASEPAEEEEEIDPAAAAAQSLIDMGVVALIGAYRSQPTAAAAQVAAEAGVPLISGTASLDSITDGESYDFGQWFDRLAPTVDMHSRLFFAYIKHLNQTQSAGITSVALAYKDDYFGEEVLRSFNEQAEAQGLKVVARIAYKDENDDLATAALRMMSNQPQAVFHYGDVADVTAFVNYYGQARFNPQAAFCYDVSYQDPAFQEAAAAAKAEYWCGLSALLPPAEDEDEAGEAAQASDIVSGDSKLFDYINSFYREQTGVDMDNEALYDFAAVIVLAQAVGKAGSTDPELLSAALRENEFPAPYLASGRISFSELGQNRYSTGYLTRLTAEGFEPAFKSLTE